MSTASPADLPQRGPGLRKQATVEQWATLAKSAVATIHCEPDACDDCKPLDGDRMGLPEAEEKLPVHPNCRCNYTWEWRPGKALSVTPRARASERSFQTRSTMHDTIYKSVQADGVVDKTPNGKDDGEYLKVPISSTRKDRDGDSFSEDGLRDLRDQIQTQNTPLFGNHGVSDGGGLFSPRYQWQDIIGGQEDAEIVEETVDDEEHEILNSYVRPNPANEEGQMLLEYAKAGMPVGFSVGFRPLEKESNEETGENVFHSTDLLETSAVGIQSNRESVHTDAAEAELLAKGAIARLPDADLDEETLAKAIVSESSAYGASDESGTTRGAGGPTEPAERRDHNMGDTPADDGQVTHEQLDKRLEEQRKDLVKDITDAIGDGESEADEADEKDVDDDLQEKVDNLDTTVKELTEKVDDLDPEESETTTAKEPDNEDDANGTNDETAGDNEDETEDPPDEGDEKEAKRWI